MILIVYRLFVYFLFIIPRVSYGADTLVGDESLSGDQTLVSKDGRFEMGFFRAGKSPHFYLGIWYYNITITYESIVWVANRDTPVSDIFSSEVKIINGKLVLLNESNIQVWSTNTVSRDTPVSTVLRDDGNLILTYIASPSLPIWQSFDYPTHVFLAGNKLGYNKRSNKTQILTSWRSREDPAVGLFSLETDQDKNQFVIKWNRSQEYWVSGPWNGEIFSDVPEMRYSYIFNFSYIENVNETYFTYSFFDPSIISRLDIDFSGQIHQQIWSKSANQWNLFWSRPRQQSLQCGRNPDFFMIKVKNLPPKSSVSVAVGSGGKCRAICFNNCSCNAYSFVDIRCSFWDGDLMDLSEDETNGKKIYIKVPSKDLNLPKNSINKKNELNLGAVVGSIAGAVFILGIALFIVYRKKRTPIGRTSMDGSLVVFAYKDLQAATKNFSDKLGGGGFGSVFKGVLRDSSIVAVKKLESISQGEKQFRSEVSTIGIIQHINLVRLRGFCAVDNDQLLVYEYMPYGSLHSHLFNEKQDTVLLDWKTRYEIALGIARGLVYLHEKCRECIIHCDIKPENILLDTNFCPKIADFGMAKLLGRDFSRVLTSMRGTRGYLAPEWLSGEAVTAKADVFSYGMMLFELVHGKRNSQIFEDSSITFFPSLAANVVIMEGDILSLLDSRLNREACVEQVMKIFKIAYWCIQDEEENRPSMSQVEHILEGVLDVNMPPIPGLVQFFVDETEHVLSFNGYSSNERSDSQYNNAFS